MAKYAGFRELVVWQKGTDLADAAIGRLLFGLWRSLFVGAVCYSLALLTTFASMQWAVFQILRL
jgi:hypothetical protein